MILKKKTSLEGKEKILVVDDEPALLHLCAEILSQYGYDVVCAKSANQALNLLSKESVDLLLTDVIMPDMDGHELAAIVRKKYPVIKIQLVSGFADDGNREVIDESLLQNMINKPYSSEMLLKRVRQLLGENSGVDRG